MGTEPEYTLFYTRFADGVPEAARALREAIGAGQLWLAA
jgi:hypothetical protein